MPSPDTRVLTAHVPAQLASQVERIAARGWVVKQALAAWVHREEERQRLTLEALADVDAGRTVDQAEVDAWAQSLSTEHPKPIPPSA